MTGADHAAELGYVFGIYNTDLPGGRYSRVGETDHKIGEMMVKAWVSFAKTG